MRRLKAIGLCVIGARDLRGCSDHARVSTNHVHRALCVDMGCYHGYIFRRAGRAFVLGTT